MSRKVRIEATFTPPADTNFLGVHGYLEAPDFSYGPTLQVDSTNVDTTVIQGERIDLGINYATLPNAAGNIVLSFHSDLDFPEQLQTWRLYLQSVGTNYDPGLVAANKPSPTPSVTFTVAPKTSFAVGEEYAPLVNSVTVTLETRFEQASYSYRPTVTWLDPTTAAFPDRIYSFAGAEVVVLPLVGVVANATGFGRNANPNAQGFASRYKVGSGVMTWTGNWAQIPAIQETHTGEVCSYDNSGNVNTFSPLVTPQFTYNTPSLQSVRQNGGDTTTPGVSALPLTDGSNFSLTAGYGYDTSGNFDFILDPRFTVPSDPAVAYFGVVLERPLGSGSYHLLGYPSVGDGSSTDDRFYFSRDIFPVASETWGARLISYDVNGHPKYPDAESLVSLAATGTSPNFGSSPSCTFSVLPQASALGTGTEYSSLVTSISGGVFYIVGADGIEQFGFQGGWVNPSDSRYQGLVPTVIYSGSSTPIPLCITGKDDTSFKTNTWPVVGSSGTLYFLSQDASGRTNSIQSGVTPGIGFTISTQTSGKVDLSRADSGKFSTSHFRKNPSNNKFEVTPNGIGSTEIGPGAVGNSQLANGTVDYSKFFTNLRPIEIVGSLPSSFSNYPAGSVVTLSVNQKIYRSTGSSWTTATAGTDIVVDTALINNIQAVGIQATSVVSTWIATQSLSATQFTSGTGSIGGPGMPGAFNVYNTSGTAIGFIGTSGGVSGAWFKTLGVGGTSYATSGIKADASGNVVINGADFTSISGTYLVKINGSGVLVTGGAGTGQRVLISSGGVSVFATAGSLPFSNLGPTSLAFDGLGVVGPRQADPGSGISLADVRAILLSHGLIG